MRDPLSIGESEADGAPARLRLGIVVFWAIHAACLLVFWTGVSRVALVACVATYTIQLFGVTAGYHRYFAHRTYRTTRPFQLVLALLGASAVQQGPLWWAGHHRHHHRYTDTPDDVHPPGLRGFWWAHVGWVASGRYLATRTEAVRDLERFAELRFLDRHFEIVPLGLAAALFALGSLLAHDAPSLGTSGAQMLVWGFAVATTLSSHATFTINSLAHVFGRRRFATPDESRNSFPLSLLTFGEGWHNNHHRYPSSERQGFYWWEIDLTHYGLTALSWLRLVWDLREPPKSVYVEAAGGPVGEAETAVAEST
jgi:stearoyl-CoA desaturase (delta-9 desaturase)